jgi:hypothetical protein
MNKEIRNLVAQAEANEIYAAITSNKKNARKLNKVARDMTKEAIRIANEIDPISAEVAAMSDSELLVELGL